jgi:ABC-type transport system involved in multi-copper enzyme maturation permease subunit
LIGKEWRELLVSRSWWALLLAIGPLAGMSFIAAMHTYAEVSGLNGGSAGVGEAMAPLIGVWAPTFSACELAAVFLLPFVAIRVVAGDKQSGALKLELQQPLSPFARISAKGLALLAGWLIAMIPPFLAIALWKSYGGALYPPELFALTLGHVLNAGLTIAIAAAMASVTEHPSTAAVLTLGFTVGTWILDFIAAVQGGFWERVASYTPAAMVAQFQHGLVQLDTVLIASVLIATGLAFAALWMRLGAAVRRRAYESAVLGAIACAAIFVSSMTTASWDASENRANSFSEGDERALEKIHGPLRIEVHLAQEDPRRTDLDRRVIAKLRRLLPHLEVRYIAATSTGMFEQASPHYGEIWYEVDGKKTMSRAVTEEGALEAIYSLSGTAPPAEGDEPVFRGHPLAVEPRGAGVVFYGLWPAAVIAAAVLRRRTR